jgi:hypothetical protein
MGTEWRCACGCGETTEGATFKRGHNSRLRGRTAEGLKICPGCGETLPLDEFVRCRNRRDGVAGYCRKCHGAKTARYYRGSETAREKRRARDARGRRASRADPVRAERYRQVKHRCDEKLKTEMIRAYGGRCTCCGEARMVFLTIEHTKRDGAAHRSALGNGGGASVWRDLRKRGWPKEGFTILCWNCNMATRFGAECPHKAAVTVDGA